jgi:hypothetical protein
VKGRIRKGWYREPGMDEHHVTKVARIAGAWIATVYDRRHARPCACGAVVYPQLWASLTPGEPIEGISLDRPDDD